MTTPAIGTALDAALEGLPSTSLAALGDATLLNRVDTKYIVPASLVPDLVAACRGSYAALVVDGARTFAYHTRYFDTPTLDFFRAHVTGRLPRRKVRIRSYARGGRHVLELKRKTSKGRTEKLRMDVDANDASALAALGAGPFANAQAPDPRAVHPTLDVAFTRATLVNTTAAERVTIDLDLAYVAGDASLAFPDSAIIEVKQQRRARSPVIDLLRRARQRPTRISKYCAGIAALLAPAPVPTYRRLLSQLHAPPDVPSLGV